MVANVSLVVERVAMAARQGPCGVVYVAVPRDQCSVSYTC